MQKVSWRGDEGNFEVVLRRPTIRDGVLTEILAKAMAEACVDRRIIPAMASYVPHFIACVSIVQSSKGLPFAIPDLNTPIDEVIKAYLEWVLLPEKEFTDPWYSAAISIREPELPKAKGNEKSAPTRSGNGRGKSQKRGSTKSSQPR